MFFKFAGCLNATIGDLGNIFDILLSAVIVFQCLCIMFEMLGSLGLNVKAQITLSFGFLVTFFKASPLSVTRALLIAAFITPLLYFLDNRMT
jgi:hypothetical protein